VEILFGLGGHTIWAIRGFHPRYFLRFGHEDEASERILLQLIRDVYKPCALWRRVIVVVALRSIIPATPSLISAMEAAKHGSRCLSQDRALEELFAKLLSALRDFRDSLGGAVRCLEDAGDYN
jgi:hypothetical protein